MSRKALFRREFLKEFLLAFDSGLIICIHHAKHVVKYLEIVPEFRPEYFSDCQFRQVAFKRI